MVWLHLDWSASNLIFLTLLIELHYFDNVKRYLIAELPVYIQEEGSLDKTYIFGW